MVTGICPATPSKIGTSDLTDNVSAPTGSRTTAAGGRCCFTVHYICTCPFAQVQNFLSLVKSNNNSRPQGLIPVYILIPTLLFRNTQIPSIFLIFRTTPSFSRPNIPFYGITPFFWHFLPLPSLSSICTIFTLFSSVSLNFPPAFSAFRLVVLNNTFVFLRSDEKRPPFLIFRSCFSAPRHRYPTVFSSFPSPVFPFIFLFGYSLFRIYAL